MPAAVQGRAAQPLCGLWGSACTCSLRHHVVHVGITACTVSLRNHSQFEILLCAFEPMSPYPRVSGPWPDPECRRRWCVCCCPALATVTRPQRQLSVGGKVGLGSRVSEGSVHFSCSAVESVLELSVVIHLEGLWSKLTSW